MNVLTYFISADYFDVLIKRMSRKKIQKLIYWGNVLQKICTGLRKRKKKQTNLTTFGEKYL